MAWRCFLGVREREGERVDKHVEWPGIVSFVLSCPHSKCDSSLLSPCRLRMLTVTAVRKYSDRSRNRFRQWSFYPSPGKVLRCEVLVVCGYSWDDWVTVLLCYSDMSLLWKVADIANYLPDYPFREIGEVLDTINSETTEVLLHPIFTVM